MGATVKLPGFGLFLGSIVVSLVVSGRPASAEPLWPRRPCAELAVTAAPFAPSLSTVRLSVPGGRIGEAGWLKRFDAHAWYLADSAYLCPVSYLEAGVGVRCAWLERRRLLLESGLGTAFSLQTLAGTLAVPLLVDGLARYALGSKVCLLSELELLFFGQGFAASGRLGARWRPFRFGLLLGASAGYGYVAAWDLAPGGGAVQLALSAGYEL